jgi:hypothetical protein
VFQNMVAWLKLSSLLELYLKCTDSLQTPCWHFTIRLNKCIIIVLRTSVRKVSYDVTLSVWVCHVHGSCLVGTEIHERLYCSLEPWPSPEVYIKVNLQGDMTDCTECALNEMMSSFGTF